MKPLKNAVFTAIAVSSLLLNLSVFAQDQTTIIQDTSMVTSEVTTQHPTTTAEATTTEDPNVFRYGWNNGNVYLDTNSIPPAKIYVGQKGQIRPLQDSPLKDFQYAFTYKLVGNQYFSLDEKGNWEALLPGKVALQIFPAKDEPNFFEEMQKAGYQFAEHIPTIAFPNPIYTIEILPSVTPVYRLYNPGMKVHLFTNDENEYSVLKRHDWLDEGIAWYTHNLEGEPVYRLYNPGLKIHLYTKDVNEYKVLSTRGWNQEGVAYHSKGKLAVYRLYHPGIKKHHYTTSSHEKDILSKEQGWEYEGIAWYSEDTIPI